MSHSVSWGAIDQDHRVIVRQRPATSRGRRPPHSGRRGATGRLQRLPSVIVLGLVLITSTLAIMDLYLLASSGLH
jgi:hypothetical protein